MPIGVTPEHEQLHDAARGLLSRHSPPALPRASLAADAEGLPACWGEVAAAGWFGLHLPEEMGGSGFGLSELVVVVEELGRAVVPGPVLPTLLAGLVLDRCAPERLRKELLPALADGSLPAAVAMAGPVLPAERVAGGLAVRGTVQVCGAGPVGLVLVPVTGPDGTWFCALDAASVQVAPLPSADATRRMAAVTVDCVVAPERTFRVDLDRVRELAALLYAAEACGIGSWCLDTAVAHARTREQFGRPVGTFQAVKHRCADLLVAVEQARAATWDAARVAADDPQAALTVAVAAALALDLGVRAAKDCIQLLGGVGFTWEHDAHIYLKRALAVRQLLGPTASWRQRVAGLALAGGRRALDLDLPAEAEAYRGAVQELLASLAGLDDAAVRERLASSGYLSPHWPAPWGRGAGPVEQLVIDEEFRRARVRRPGLAVGAWAVPTLVAHGTAEQQERWIPGTLRGDLSWCQLFSEPGAGSDLAGLSTRATRVEGGWRVTGQKVWTTLAHAATHGILLARTTALDPANRQAGITYFILDMSAPGIEIRPLRELTGHEMFNEVFLTDVFVPDDCVVGEVGDGWRLARTTLANERVQMGTGSSFGTGVESLLSLAGDAAKADPALRERLGFLVAEAQSLAVLSYRSTLRAIGGVSGPETSVRKLLGAEHEQRVQEAGLEVLGPAGAVLEGPTAHWFAAFLATRCLTIAGGTSEVQRNVIAERLLGLPKDPLPGR